MQNNYKSNKTFYVLCLLIVFDFLPTSMAGENANVFNSETLQAKLDSALTCAIEENPDVNECNLNVNLKFTKDSQTGEWGIRIEAVESVIAVQNTSEIDDEISSDDIDEDEQLTDSEESTRGNFFIFFIVVIVFLIIFLALFPRFKAYFLNYRRRPQKDEEYCDKGNDCINLPKSDNTQVRSDKQTCNVNDGEHVKDSDQVISPDRNELQNTNEPVIGHEHLVVTENPPQAPSKKPVVKYGRIAILGRNELVTEDDYLSDDASGMPFEFIFSPNMDQGTYDIASTAQMSFLRDISYIRPFVQEFERVPNASKIVTISKGKLRKQGYSWIVTEKLKIKLT